MRWLLRKLYQEIKAIVSEQQDLLIIFMNFNIQDDANEVTISGGSYEVKKSAEL